MANVTLPLNSSELTVEQLNELESITKDDAAWILANAFLILTMQTGFGMLEAGSVSPKNVANIMVKNVVDVSLGGVLYWAFGYGLSFGSPSNWFCGFGNFFLSDADVRTFGTTYATYVFQFSFATAATTIVSGAVAERMKLQAYMLFSALNIFVYCIPASWAWAEKGWLSGLGFFDFAGACVVHMNGGASALVAAWMLGPRLGRFTPGEGARDFALSSPVTALTGTFMLWWAWLAFNCGSTFGISGTLWKTAVKSAINTLNGSIGGSLVGLGLSWFLTPRKDRYFDIGILISSVLGGLVGITSCCSIIQPWEALVCGAIGGLIASLAMPLVEWLKIDDPVGAIAVHFIAAIWSTLAVGLFGDDEFGALGGNKGLFHGGGWYLLGVQAIGVVAVTGWAMFSTAVIFLAMKHTIGIRMSRKDELLGADWSEHNVKSEGFASKLERAFDEMKIRDEDMDHIIRSLTKELMKGDRSLVDARVRNFAGGQTAEQIMNTIEAAEAHAQAPPHPELAQPAPEGTGNGNLGALRRLSLGSAGVRKHRVAPIEAPPPLNDEDQKDKAAKRDGRLAGSAPLYNGLARRTLSHRRIMHNTVQRSLSTTLSFI